MSKRKSIAIIILLSIAILVVGFMCFAPQVAIPGTVKDYNGILSKVGRGIDLSGGYYVVLTPENSHGETGQEVLEQAMDILRARLDDKGYTEAVISIQDGDKIRVEIPQVEDDGSVLEIIGQTGRLTFKDYTGKEWINGEDHIESAYVAQNTQDGGYLVILNFKNRGSSRFAEATAAVSAMEDKALYIYLGDTLVSQPTVAQQINSASAQIEGYKTYEDALSIASVIDSGKLPIEYTVSESRSISSKLGENAIGTSALMGAVGLLVIFIIMIIRYRGLGLVACISLCIYVLLYIILLAAIPSVQLTLPGIAGILLSIGMAVDANIVIFERIREEFAMDKTVGASIDHGFRHAAITVLDSNITTIFAAIVLWLLCPGTIKGFAITLLIGIVLSLFTSIILSKWLVKVFAPLANDEEKFFNLKRVGGENNA